MLALCLKLAAEQTRSPKEIVIVDASPYWQSTKENIMQEVASHHPNIRWEYVKAVETSLTVQRNQGLRLATADILFLLDDDSMMHSNCAEEIMKAYEIDKDEKVLGIAAALDENPKTCQTFSIAVLFNKLSRYFGLVEWQFLPYDFKYPFYVIPAELKELDVVVVNLFSGCSMTFRRKIFEKELFEEALVGPSNGEDLDLSYRISKHGMLLLCKSAKLQHLKSESGGCSTPYFFDHFLFLLNTGFFHMLHSTDINKSKKKIKSWVIKIAILDSIKDIVKGKWSIPHGRSNFLAFFWLNKIFSKSKEELKTWYPRFQKELLNKNDNYK